VYQDFGELVLGVGYVMRRVILTKDERTAKVQRTRRKERRKKQKLGLNSRKINTPSLIKLKSLFGVWA
jgi:hypothetical protein